MVSPTPSEVKKEVIVASTPAPPKIDLKAQILAQLVQEEANLLREAKKVEKVEEIVEEKVEEPVDDIEDEFVV